MLSSHASISDGLIVLTGSADLEIDLLVRGKVEIGPKGAITEAT